MNPARFIGHETMIPCGNRLPSIEDIFPMVQALGFASHGFPWFALFTWFYYYYKLLPPSIKIDIMTFIIKIYKVLEPNCRCRYKGTIISDK